ncbi:Rha family transcriptional regulator [Furfurilactobacillus entadae]|uniref:Rha family transcriptional regulator n=1 Tax=Furfurilactobacillus entadae TaxID=2922307 RepID=UPI0035EAA9C0
MQDYVFTNSLKITDELYTTADVIAEYSNNTLKAVNDLIRNYQTELKAFGKVEFSVLKSLNPKGGRPRKQWHLNENQATFLITLLDNTPQVVAFKLELVKQFSKQRRQLQHAQMLYQQGKTVSKSLGDAIKENENSNPHDYANYNRLIYKTALGVSTVELKRSRHVGKHESLTQYLTAKESLAVQKVKNQVITLLELKMGYGVIKSMVGRQGIIYQVTLPAKQEVVSNA